MKLKKPKGMPEEVWKHVQNLKDGCFYLRYQSVIELGEIKHESSAPYLIQALKDENSSVRRVAAKALGRIKHKNAVEPLTKALKDVDPNVRHRAAEALDKIGEPAVPALIQALKDKNHDVKGYVTWALEEIGESLEKKRRREEKLTPEGEKLLKAITLLENAKLQKNEEADVKAHALHAALTGEIDEKNARLYIKQLRAHEGHLK